MLEELLPLLLAAEHHPQSPSQSHGHKKGLFGGRLQYITIPGIYWDLLPSVHAYTAHNTDIYNLFSSQTMHLLVLWEHLQFLSVFLLCSSQRTTQGHFSCHFSNLAHGFLFLLLLPASHTKCCASPCWDSCLCRVGLDAGLGNGDLAFDKSRKQLRPQTFPRPMGEKSNCFWLWFTGKKEHVRLVCRSSAVTQ